MSGSTVLSFARLHLGQRVGRGECWDLANEALRSGGDRTSSDYGPVGPNTDYVWGTPIDPGQLQPGDVIQFRTHRCRVDVARQHEDGSAETSFEESTRNHHTAVVASTGAGGRVTLLEQNFQGVRSVAENTTWLDGGTTRTREREEGATVEVTRTITVTGSWQCYRPQARAGSVVP